MNPALEAVRFFATSANGVRVFEALDDGVTTSRGLAERTGASRSTVARILATGEDRGWVASEGSQYELTTEGRAMIEEIRGCLRTVEGIQHLGEALDWLPAPARSLEYHWFRDADIVTGRPSNPTEPFDYVSDRIRSATEIRTLAWTGVPRLTKLIDGQSRTGELNCEAVMQADFLDGLDGRPEAASHWRGPTARDEVWRYDGDVPISLHVIDETTVIWLDERRGEELVVRGALVTENRAVLSWAESLYREYRGEAELLDPTTLSEA